MKGKITIVLLGLALVFGMIAASCDNGPFPDVDDTKDVSMLVFYKTDSDKLPVLDSVYNSPVRLSADDIAEKLGKKETSSGGYVPEYVSGTVAYDSTLHTTDAKRDLALKYAGLPILVKNPLL